MEYENKPSRHDLIKESGWTVEDYNQLPEDGNQYEIIDGKLEFKPSPTTTHQRICSNLDHLISQTCRMDYIIMESPIDVILSETETRQPDLLMIHRSREHIIAEHAIIGPPDLVAEIISPSSAKRDRTMKKDSYARFGVLEYWIVDPANRTLEQYVLLQEGQPYHLAELYVDDEVVRSEHLKCVSFTVEEMLKL